MLDICKSIHGWLCVDKSHVCVIHSANGISKVATAVCAYLAFSKLLDNVTDALDYFKYRLGLNSKAIPISQERYLDYFDHLISTGGHLTNPHPSCIQEIVVNNIPYFEGDQVLPGLEVYENGSILVSTLPKRRYASSSLPVDISVDGDQVYFRFPKNYSLVVERDVQIRIFREIQTHAVNQVTTIASFSYHTGFVPIDGVIRVTIKDLEVHMENPAIRYPPNFSLDLVLNGTTVQDNGLITYSKLIEFGLSKCLTRLACYHSVPAKENLVATMESLGYPRYLGSFY